jgi:hypothetical protein
MDYTVYNKIDGEIINNVECNPDQIEIQYDSIVSAYIEGTYDRITQKIIGGIAVNKTQEEYDVYQYNLVEGTIPPITKGLTDAELDIIINDYFHGQEDIIQWKLDNYSILRKRNYLRTD